MLNSGATIKTILSKKKNNQNFKKINGYWIPRKLKKVQFRETLEI